MAHGKRYRQQYGKVQRDQAYPPAEAVALIKETASAKFDETVELHMLLGLNVRHAEEQLRGTLALPHGLGKDVTIAVFAQGQQARDAESAGADFVGGDDLAEKVEEGWTDFDVAIATPQMMGTVGKLGRVLGPQGKMPNPKVGTVTDDVEKAVTELESRQGRVPHRPPGDRPHDDRQGQLRRRQAARELHRGDRRDRPRQALVGQGQIHPLGDPDDDDGPRASGSTPARPATARPAPAAAERRGARGRPRRRPPRSRPRRPPRLETAEEPATA